MLSFGTTVWSPSLFERSFGWAPGQPGLAIGLVTLAVSPLGLIVGGWLANRRARAGHDDANMRVVLWASLGVVPFALAYPLMPTPGLALAMLAGSLFCGSVGVGPANTALQVITPGRMRGTVSALHIAVFNVVGYGLGPLLVALLTDRLFGDEAMLATSMALAAALLAPLGLWASWAALRPYAAAAAEARAREP
jgi:MFS family permease